MPRNAIRKTKKGVQFGNPEAIRANLRIDSRESGHLSYSLYAASEQQVSETDKKASKATIGDSLTLAQIAEKIGILRDGFPDQGSYLSERSGGKGAEQAELGRGFSQLGALVAPMRSRVQSRSRTRLRIAASIAFSFRACFKGVRDTIARLSPLSGLERGG